MAIGVGLFAWAYLLWRILGYPVWIVGAFGFFNIILGIITPKSRKVDLLPEPSGSVKLVVDKVTLGTGLRATSYELALFDNKLVMKKLTSWGITTFAIGVSLLFGGFFGGYTGISVQEFLDQRKRDTIRTGNQFATIARGDREITYQNMSQVQLTGLDLRMVVGGQLLMYRMGAEYPPLMARRLREIIPDERWARQRFQNT